MSQWLAFLTVTGPLLLLIPGIMPNAWCDRNPVWTTRLVTGAAHAAFLTSLLAVAGFLQLGRVDQALLGMEIYLDALSGIMLLLVACIGTVVIRYSRRYLDGDPGQGHFFKWLALTIGSVLVLVISGNLIQFTLAWMATSLSLHRALLFYPERPSARLAAHKKFVISRLGDLCLVAAMFLIYRTFGSLHFGEIFADAERHARHAAEGLSPWSAPGLFWIGLLLVFGAALKSAQFPFHSWLPEVMETPTPVSALMHAGIINAGGFLIVRMSPVMVLSPTALFGALVMLTQNSIKKSLALWCLAGNAIFIAAPRHRTRGVALEGRAFLHEYDDRQDTDGAILSLIMTAPMVVASWINLQYYGSTVDNRLFGSGNKVLHNVVGTFGVLEGNGGDLRVGLPWQSVHDGQDCRHEPRRLTVLIEAPAAAIERVLEDQPAVRQLVEHHWLHLLRINPDDGRCHRYRAAGQWQALSTD